MTTPTSLSAMGVTDGVDHANGVAGEINRRAADLAEARHS
jgi:hypothetical protein